MLNRRVALQTITLGAIAAFGLGSARAEVAVWDVQRAHDAAISGDIVLIDIRTPREWQASGIADVAHALSMIDRNFTRDFTALLDANPGKTPAFICATGVRSTRLTKLLESRGLSTTINVAAGMLGEPDGWIARGLPTRSWSADN